MIRGAKEGKKPMRWTAMEDNILFTQASDVTGKELEALLPGRSYAAIKSRMHCLGIKHDDQCEIQQPWTPEEDDILRTWAAKIGVPTTRSRYLPHRTRAAIYSRAKRLGITGREYKVPQEDKDLIFALFMDSELSVSEIAEKFELSVPYTNRLGYAELEERYEKGKITSIQYYRTVALRIACTKARLKALNKLEDLYKKQFTQPIKQKVLG